jgi:hypothetical protein
MDPVGDTLVKSYDFVTTFMLEQGALSTKIVIRVPDSTIYPVEQVKTLKLILKVETCPLAIPIVDTLYYTLRAPFEGEGVVNYTSSLVTIAPNPSDGKFTLTNENSLINEFEVYDLSGRLVAGMKNVNSDVYILDGSRFQNGVYFIKIKTEAGTVIKKIIKQ